MKGKKQLPRNNKSLNEFHSQRKAHESPSPMVQASLCLKYNSVSAGSDTNNILDVDEQKSVDFKRKIRQARKVGVTLKLLCLVHSPEASSTALTVKGSKNCFPYNKRKNMRHMERTTDCSIREM